MVVRGRGEDSGDRLNQWAATRLVGCFGGVKLTRGPCTLCALLARVCRTMQLAPFRCADGRCGHFIDRALASDCSNLTTHAIPDIRETNNHWTSCQPLSLHGLGQGSGSLGIRTGQGTQYCTVVAGSSVPQPIRSPGGILGTLFAVFPRGSVV